MVVTGWNNGAHSRNGAGYGFRVQTADRDAFFQKDWTSIQVELEGEEGMVDIPLPGEAFWSENSAPLVSPAVGRWLRKNGLAPWARGNPPTFILDPIEGNRFRVRKAPRQRPAF